MEMKMKKNEQAIEERKKMSAVSNRSAKISECHEDYQRSSWQWHSSKWKVGWWNGELIKCQFIWIQNELKQQQLFFLTLNATYTRTAIVKSRQEGSAQKSRFGFNVNCNFISLHQQLISFRVDVWELQLNHFIDFAHTQHTPHTISQPNNSDNFAFFTAKAMPES